MIFAEYISLRTYYDLRDAFIQHNPVRSWGLTEFVEGQPYYIEKADTVACIKDVGDLHCEVLGAFKLTHAAAYEPGALAINKLIRSFGYRKASLTCFEPVSAAWKRQGWVQSERVALDASLAPSAWSEQYGKPDVLTMWRTF